MRRCLVRKLGYSPMEVSHMKADVAAVVVSKMLKRPKIGMPLMTLPQKHQNWWPSYSVLLQIWPDVNGTMVGYSILAPSAFITIQVLT